MQDATTYDFFHRKVDPSGSGKVTWEGHQAQHESECPGIENLPPFECVRFRLLMGLIEGDPNTSDKAVAQQVVFTRQKKPACHTCSAKPGEKSKRDPGGAKVNLQLCGHCKLTWYCSRECQVFDWKKGNHKNWCRKGDAAEPHVSAASDVYLSKPDQLVLGSSLPRKAWGAKDVAEARKGRLWVPGRTCNNCAPMRSGKTVFEARVCSKCFYGRFCRECEPTHYDDHVSKCDGGYFAHYKDLDKAARLSQFDCS